MTQIGEAVAIGMVDEDEVECPFDHDNPTPPEVDNQLIGEGGKLATKMGNGTSTHLYAPLKVKRAVVKNPKAVKGHPFFEKCDAVTIIDTDAATGERHVHKYPVTSAAHHLIPAQEALKVSRLLAFMVKKGSSAQLKGATYTTGAVWANVGYEVNGSENGVYLPGSYAVGGGKGGLGLWTENDDHPDKEEEDVTEAPDIQSSELTGALNQITETNRKWRYVRQAMKLAPGHFHDRHESYSRFVTEILNKIFSDYRRLYQRSIKESACSKCKEKGDKIKELGIPTPFGLVTRLDMLADNLRICLNGSSWRPNVFTSKWGEAFMRERRAGNPAARLIESE
ncbi:MAG: hypothetical protein HGA75_09455 [Thiobacillus sp.]|nr:hypothetical protein [Thiobacillus sp.]